MDGMSLATSILTRAVSLDNGKRYTESLVVYQEGIHVLLEYLKTVPASDKTKRDKIRTRVEEYMSRAESLKKNIEELKDKGNYREQAEVKEDATGFSYRSVFSRFLDADVSEVQIDDPYIRSVHQCDNLVRFLELCLQNCPQLRRVKLKTGRDTGNTGKGSSDQLSRLDVIKNSLKHCQSQRRNSSLMVDLNVEYSETLHDREIRLDNGWVIKVGRGLDYFKPADRFTIGFTDFDFRPCRATTIDIFHRKDLVKVK